MSEYGKKRFVVLLAFDLGRFDGDVLTARFVRHALTEKGILSDGVSGEVYEVAVGGVA